MKISNDITLEDNKDTSSTTGRIELTYTGEYCDFELNKFLVEYGVTNYKVLGVNDTHIALDYTYRYANGFWTNQFNPYRVSSREI